MDITPQDEQEERDRNLIIGFSLILERIKELEKEGYFDPKKVTQRKMYRREVSRKAYMKKYHKKRMKDPQYRNTRRIASRVYYYQKSAIISDNEDKKTTKEARKEAE